MQKHFPNNHENRIDYILIWGHGTILAPLIIDKIHINLNFSIKKIIYHKPQTIKSLINVIYSYDYAPIEHLISKTKYLETTPNEVIFIFIENKNPNIDFIGEGAYRHSESITLKELKENIRNKYNPKDSGKRSENHVIHASDNELQADYALKYLGFNNGIGIFKNENKFISCPYYIDKIKTIHIKKINIDFLLCNIVIGSSRYDYSVKTKKLSESPQYKGLTENISIYKEYLDTFIGGALTEYYSPEKLIKLSTKLKYLENDATNNYILVKKIDGKFLILDGLHRAAILASRGLKEITVGEIIE